MPIACAWWSIAIAFLLILLASTSLGIASIISSTAFAPSFANQLCRCAHPPHDDVAVERTVVWAAKEEKTTKKKNKVGKHSRAFNGFGRNIAPTIKEDAAEDRHGGAPHETRTAPAAAAAAADSTTSSSTIHTNLIRWLSSHPITHISSKLSVKPSSALGGEYYCGYGGFADAAMSQRELILRIPRQLCVTHDDALHDPDCGRVFQSMKNQRPASWGMILLAGWIAKEYVMARALEYYSLVSSNNTMDDDDDATTHGATDINRGVVKHNPYLQSLPWTRGGSFGQDHILFWSEEEVETLLSGSKAYEDAVLIRNTVEDATQRLVDVVSPIIIRNIQLGNGNNSRKDDQRKLVMSSVNADIEADIRERYIRAVKGAFVIALSRSFAEEVESDTVGDDDDGNTTIETENVLLPLIDILQHSNTPNTILESYDDYIELRARRDIDMGEELFHQYQEEREDVIPPHKFFTRYGFIPGIREPINELLKRRSDLFF